MYIDFHVHAFADKIAEKAIDGLKKNADTPNITNGTFSDTIRVLNQRGVESCVFLSIATKPTQQTVVNNWAKTIIEEGYYAFGSIHPDAEDKIEEIQRIKDLGLNGIKLHPEYQTFTVNDPKMFGVYGKCEELGLPITFHCGYDPIMESTPRCTPKGVAEIADKFPNLTIIAAHLGGVKEVDETLEYLAGKPGKIFFDTGIVSYYMTVSQAEQIIKKHGADRVLFASDCPWGDPKNIIEAINQMSLSDNEKDMIFYKNAEKLLGIKATV